MGCRLVPGFTHGELPNLAHTINDMNEMVFKANGKKEVFKYSIKHSHTLTYYVFFCNNIEASAIPCDVFPFLPFHFITQ